MHGLMKTRTALAALALLFVPALAACGSSESTDTGLPAAQGQKSAGKAAEKKADPKNAADAQEKYDDCLRQHGVQFNPDGSATGDWDVYQAAQDACKELHDALPVQEIAPDAEAKIMKTQLQLAKCLRDLGYDYPDPSAGGGTTTFSLKPGQSSEQFEKDRATCADEAGLGGAMVSSSGGQ